MGLSETVARIYGMMTNIDDNLGRLFSVLKRLNLDENTIFIFMSDNGPARPQRYNSGLRGIKAQTYDGGTRVPFYIKWPDKFKAGKKVDRQIRRRESHAFADKGQCSLAEPRIIFSIQSRHDPSDLSELLGSFPTI